MFVCLCVCVRESERKKEKREREELPYDPSCPSLGRLVGRLVSHNLKLRAESYTSMLLSEHLLVYKYTNTRATRFFLLL